MTFAWPHLLWLSLIPLALLVGELIWRRRSDRATEHPKIVRADIGRHALRLSPSSRSSAGARVRPWLFLGLLCGVVAVARPQWGRLDEPVFEQAREIVIAIDLSRSMLAPDIKPSRLDRAKLLTEALLERLTGERVGLVVFAGTAFVQCPLSSDYEILREFLPALGPDFLPQGGSNYTALIQSALSAFGATAAADRFLIVLSDGEATDDTWRDELPALKEKNVRVLSLGVGTAAGAMLPDGSGGLVKDERGAVVLSKLETATLRELAQSTNGVYQDASNWIDLAALIESTVETGRKGEFLEKNTVRLVERFQWPLALGLWFLLISFYYEFPVRPKPRELKLDSGPEPSPPTTTRSAAATSPSEPTITTVSLILLLLPLSLLSPRAHAAAPATSEAPPLTRIVTRLSAAPQPTARDWAEFARETVTWGSRLQSSQQPVLEGPVRDALSAVDLGAKLDPKTADWPKLREELEALLQKPENQKEDEKQQPPQQDQQQQDQQNRDEQKQDDQQKQEQSSQDPSKKEPQQQDPSQQQQDAKQSPPDSEQKQQEKPSAFGDMKEPPPQPPQETRKVGGVPEKPEGETPPSDPSLALPLQKLDQLKNQDSPAELFKLIEGEKDQPPRKKTKDW